MGHFTQQEQGLYPLQNKTIQTPPPKNLHVLDTCFLKFTKQSCQSNQVAHNNNFRFNVYWNNNLVLVCHPSPVVHRVIEPHLRSLKNCFAFSPKEEHDVQHQICIWLDILFAHTYTTSGNQRQLHDLFRQCERKI